MQYLRLNLIDEYNNFMNAVDLADQLRNCYRFNHWFRNRKWWWAIFLWALGVGATNAYKMYERMYEEEKAKREHGLPEKWTHLQFLQELIYDFLGWESDSKPSANDCADSSVAASSTRGGASYSGYSVASVQDEFYDISTTHEGREDWFSLNGSQRITKNRMDSNFFSKRHDGKFHPSIPTTSHNAYCQYCKYKSSKEYKKRIERCLICDVNLCWSCRLEWHGHDLGAVNRMLSKKRFA